MGEAHWKSITAAELEQLHHARNDQINSGTLAEHERHKCSDAGTKRHRHTQEDKDHCTHAQDHKKYKSTHTIPDNSNGEEGTASETMPLLTPGTAVLGSTTSECATNFTSTTQANPTLGSSSSKATQQTGQPDLTSLITAMSAADMEDLCSHIEQNIDGFDFAGIGFALT